MDSARTRPASRRRVRGRHAEMADRQTLHIVVVACGREQDLGRSVLSSRTRKSTNRAAVVLRMAAMNVGKTHTAIGAFYRRLAARAGKVKAISATARKLAVLFYNALRFGISYADPGEDRYEENYKRRVVHHLHRRANRWDSRSLARAPALGFLRKASTAAGESAPRCRREAQALLSKVRRIPFERLVLVLDESGMNVAMSRSRAWVKRATRSTTGSPMAKSRTLFDLTRWAVPEPE